VAPNEQPPQEPDEQPQEPEYLKVAEVATLLRVHVRTVRDWIERGEIPAYKIGNHWRIRRADLERAMQARRVSPEPVRSGGLWDPDSAA
jgi:excisionase family DNA binding protein